MSRPDRPHRGTGIWVPPILEMQAWVKDYDTGEYEAVTPIRYQPPPTQSRGDALLELGALISGRDAQTEVGWQSRLNQLWGQDMAYDETKAHLNWILYERAPPTNPELYAPTPGQVWDWYEVAQVIIWVGPQPNGGYRY